MKKRMKFMTWVLLAGMVAEGTIPVSAANTETVEETATGLLQMEEVTLTEQQVKQSGADMDNSELELHTYYSKSGSDWWDKYKNYYVYNQLSESGKKLWDKLDAECEKYISQKVDANTSSGYYFTDVVTQEGLSANEMKNILWMFRHSNPQYYFLNNAVISTGNYYAFGIYPSFADGSARMSATSQIKGQFESWTNQVNACGTDAEKVQKIHDMIAEKVTYNDAINDWDFDEDTQYSQSVYSVFCMDTTVCAGYAMAMELLCNGSDIDAMAVTSNTHEWNKVRINDSWYNIDVTWDDDDDEIIYTYFERNDSYYDTSDSTSAYHHTEEAMWNSYLPKCTLDTNPARKTPGTLPTVSRTTATPQIVYDAATNTAQITCQTAGADIYYTLDGTTPEAAATKSYQYTGTIQNVNENLKAVAVCDTYWDSAVSLVQIPDSSTGDNNTSNDNSDNSNADNNNSENDNPGNNNNTGNNNTGNDNAGNNDTNNDNSGNDNAGNDTAEDNSSEVKNGLYEENGKYYFYENGVMAISKEAYVNGAWRWFDADGSMAVSKDVYQRSYAGAYADNADGTGKWVRYNENGEMVKGWQQTDVGTYYFDLTTGAMAKGNTVIDGVPCSFSWQTGIGLDCQWNSEDGIDYWYEGGRRQGLEGRGKEIYDPSTDAWYWLDAVDAGKKATGKDVYQESYAGAYADREDGTGKWVRYDADGHMVKGWQQTENGTYYFDLITGAMAKGTAVIDGGSYEFDETTGIIR